MSNSQRAAAEPTSENERRLRALVSVGAFSLYRMSADWRLMYQLDSESLAETREPISDWVSKYIPAEDLPEVQAAIARAIATKTPFDLEHRVWLADGSVGWVQSRAVPILGADGEIVEWFGSGTDATPRKEAELALQASEQRYRALFERMDEAYAVVEVLKDEHGAWTDFRFLEVNPAFMKHTGMPWPVGRTATELLGTPNPHWAKLYGEALDSGRSARVEESEMTLGRTFDLNIFPLSQDNQVAVLFRDVTERKQAELAARQEEERQAFLLQLSDALRWLDAPAEITAVATQLLAEWCSASRAYYVEWPAGASHAEVVRDYAADGLPSLAGRYPKDVFRDAHDRIAGGTTWVVEDASQDSAMGAAERDYYVQNGVVAWIDVPLVKRGQLCAALCLVQAEPRQWSAAEIALAEEVAERCWAAVERSVAEAAMRESEERFRSFAETSSDTLWIVDAESGRLEYLSPAYEAMWGEPRDKVLADIGHWATRVHPDDRVRASEGLEILKAGHRHTQEYRIVRPDGSIRYIHDTGFPIMQDGKPRRLGGVSQDLTERRLAEKAVAESERQARILMEGVPQLVWRAVSCGDWTWASPQWTAFTGQAEPDSHGRGWLEAVHPDDRDAAKSAWADAEESGGFSVEYRLRQAQGAYRWFTTRASPVHDEEGRIVEWLGTSTDIHDLRALQESQKTLLAELQHRVRNILALTRSVIRRASHTKTSVEDFVGHLEGRIDAMARTQAMLTRSPGRTVDLETIIQDELLAQGADSNHFRVSGPAMSLSPKVAEVMTLAVHELATNSVKYGALGNSGGHLFISWRPEPRGAANWLRFQWREAGIAVASDRQSGFGTELVTRRVPFELDGDANLEFEADELTATLAFPLSSGGSILQTDSQLMQGESA